MKIKSVELLRSRYNCRYYTSVAKPSDLILIRRIAPHGLNFISYFYFLLELGVFFLKDLFLFRCDVIIQS